MTIKQQLLKLITAFKKPAPQKKLFATVEATLMRKDIIIPPTKDGILQACAFSNMMLKEKGMNTPTNRLLQKTFTETLKNEVTRLNEAKNR